jgi:hypothetical protein
MNSRRTIAGSARGKAYTARFADFNGAIKTPVLNIHTTTDGLVLPSQTTEYRQTLVAADKARDLRQVFVEANGHCAITPVEWLATLTAMSRRLDRGRWPSDDEMSDIFVYSPKDGLRFVKFNPGRYPQPPHP